MLTATSASSLDLPFVPPEQLAPPSASFIERCSRVGPLLQNRKDEFIRRCLEEWHPAFATHEYEDKVYGYVWFEVDSAGSVKVSGLFTNGKKWSGDEGLGATLILWDDETKESFIVPINAVVGSSEFSRGSEEVWVNRSTSFTAEQWSRIDRASVEWQRFLTQEQLDYFFGGAYPGWTVTLTIEF